MSRLTLFAIRLLRPGLAAETSCFPAPTSDSDGELLIYWAIEILASFSPELSLTMVLGIPSGILRRGTASACMLSGNRGGLLLDVGDDLGVVETPGLGDGFGLPQLRRSELVLDRGV